MKKLIAVLAVLAVAQLSHAAEAGSNLSMGAEFRLRQTMDMEADMNKDVLPDNQNMTESRFKITGSFRNGEKLSANFTLLHNAMWGDMTSHGGTNMTMYNSVSGTSMGSTVSVNEAYGKWMATNSLNLTFGRYSYELADGSLIGMNDWQATPTAFEGIWANYDLDFGKLGFWATKLAEFGRGATGGFGSDPEENHYGFSLDMKNMPDAAKTIHFHVLKVSKDTREAVPATGESLLRYGVMVGGNFGPVDYKANFEAYSGDLFTYAAGITKSTKSGNMMQAQVGFSMPEMMKFRVYGLMHIDSGEDTGADTTRYDAYQYSRHNNAGLMDLFGWGNLTYMQAGVTMSPAEDLDAGVHLIMFSRTSKDDGNITNGNGTVTAVTGDKTDIGTEIDLTLDKKYDNGLTIGLELGSFTPGGLAKDNGMKDPAMKVVLNGRMNF